MDALDAWSEFHVAMVGATAALAGLVIVASSVNIAEIVKATTITSRLGAGIAGLVLAIIVGGVSLIPGISAAWYGTSVLAATAGAGAFAVHAVMVITRDPDPRAQARLLKSVLAVLPLVPYAAAGVAAFFSADTALVLVAVGCLIAIVAAIVVSWVALVEVLR
jgi:ABC-type antimicrobial peptide transport system permease subunit